MLKSVTFLLTFFPFLTHLPSSPTSSTQDELHPALKNRELHDFEVVWKHFLKHL